MNNGFQRFAQGLLVILLSALLVASGCAAEKKEEPDKQLNSGGMPGNASGGSQNTGGTGATDATGGTPDAGGADGTAGGGADDAGGQNAGEGGAGNIGGAPDLGEGSGLPNAPAGSWTYLVYVLADNNLEPFALQDLQELMAVGSGGKVTILAEVDRAVGEASDPVGGLANFTTTKRVRIDSGKLTQLADLGEQNLGDARTFREFLEWGLSYSPSEHYAVVLWDHGGAWPQFGADDSANGDGLTLLELTQGIDAAARSSGLLGPLDLIGFDACLMGTWEVAASLAGRARYLLASEEVEPGHGWDHREVVALKTGATALELGEALVAGYRAQAVAQKDDARVTLALTDLSQIGQLSRAISVLAAELGGTHLATRASVVGRARADVTTFGSVPGGPSTGMIDIAEFVTELAALDPGLTASVAGVKEALALAVVNQISGAAYPDVGGLSLFFPQLATGYDPNYESVTAAASWRGFLSEFYAAAGTLSESPEFTNLNHEALVTDLGSELQVEGQLRAGTFDNLAEATFSFGVVDQAQTLYLLGDQPASVTPAGLVSSSWDKSVLGLVQGAVEDYAYYSFEVADSGLLLLSVPLDYNDGSSEAFVLLQLVFEPDGTLLSSKYYAEASGAWAELLPLAGSSFQTLVPTVAAGASDATWEPQPQLFDASQGLDLQFIPLSAGVSVVVQLTATDYANQGDSVVRVGTL